MTEAFGLTDSAAQFMRMIYHFSQFFDDVADGDKIERSYCDLNLFNCFVGLNSNLFFIQNRLALLPVLDLIILKWQASDEAERSKQANEMSFVWRAGFYDILLATISICRGHEFAKSKALAVMQYYSETMENYKKEFPNG